MMATCHNCGGFVSEQFARVFGNNQDECFGCPDCMTQHELTDGEASAPTDEAEVPDDLLATDGGHTEPETRIADALEELAERQRVQNAVLLQIAYELRDPDDEMTGKGYAGWIEDHVLELTENVDLDAVDLHTRDGGLDS